MTCPRCKTQHDVLAYNVLEVIEEYAKETTPIYKCPKCKWMFAPAEPLAAKLLADLLEELSKLTNGASASREVATA